MRTSQSRSRALLKLFGLACLALLAALAAALTLPPSVTIVRAAVTNTGGMICTGTINGTDVGPLSDTNSSDAVQVPEHTSVTVTMQSSQTILRRLIRVVFLGSFGDNTLDTATNGGGYGWVADDSTDVNGTSWTKTIDVDQYARYGIGLYKVAANSSGPSGACVMDGFVRVAGNPFTTTAGEAGTAAGVIGLLGLAGAGVRAAGESGGDDGPSGGDDDGYYDDDVPFELGPPGAMRWCFLLTLPALLMTAGAMLGVGPPAGPPGGPVAGPPAGPAGAPGPRTPRQVHLVRWRPRLSILGMITGVLGATGFVVLLQQAGRVFPTATLVIIAWVAGLLVSGLVVPSLARLVAVGRINRRRAARLRAAPPAAP